MENKYLPIIIDTEIKVDKLYSLHYFAYSKKFHFEGESHDFWELIYCDSGEAKIIDDSAEYLLTEGCAFLHMPGHYHTVTPNNKFTNVTIVSFDGELGCLVEKNCGSKILPLNKTEKAYFKTILSEGKHAFDSPLNLVYQYSLNLRDSAPYGCIQLIKNSLENLLISLIRNANSSHKASIKTGNHTEYLAASIIGILNEKIYSKVRLADLSKSLGYSETYIKKVFKSVTGNSVIQYFIGQKIEKAKQLLSETTFTVSQISETLGFDSIQYFCRQFKKMTNMTPTAYSESIASGIL